MSSFPIHIEKSRNRTSRAFCRDGMIVIRLASNLQPVEERDHIESLVRRMRNMLEREEKKTLIDPFRSLLQGSAEERRSAHRSLWNQFSDKHIEAVSERVHAVNAKTLRVPVERVRLRFAQTQWGSCSSRGDIMLNPALLFTTPNLLEYVIIHELTHRIVTNHSVRFWQTVEGAMPGFREAYRQLRKYRLPML